MFFNDLKKYGYINAKLRSRINKILKEEELNEIRKNYKFYDFVNFLVERKYFYDEEIGVKNDLKLLELLLIKKFIFEYKSLIKDLNNKKLKEFIFTLLKKYEIDNLKNALRIWQKKNFKLEKYIIKENIYYTINYEKIFSAENIDEILNELKNTMYSKCIEAIKEKYNKTKNIFFLEFELDKCYYKELREKIKLLNKKDRKIIIKFLGYEVKLYNIMLLLRYKNYYKFDVNFAVNHLIPFLSNKPKTFFYELYTKEAGIFDITKILNFEQNPMLKSISEKISKEVSFKNKMLLIEDILNQILLTEAYNVLTGYPFNIGIIVVYFLFKRMEIENIISILNLKYMEIEL